MNNKEIAASFQLLARLMDLHGENVYKIRSYEKAYGLLSKLGAPLSEMTEEEIRALPGVGKAITEKIQQLLTTGKMKTLERYKELTPEGLQELVMIKGIGAKKIMTVWKTLGVESATELLYACSENRLVDLKGFGEKTQNEIKKQLEFFLRNRSKYIHLKVRSLAEMVLDQLRKTWPKCRIEFTGAIRRWQPVLCRVEFIVEARAWPTASLDHCGIHIDERNDQMLAGTLADSIPLRIYRADPEYFVTEWWRTTGPKSWVQNNLTVQFDDEADLFHQLGLPFLPPYARDLLAKRTTPPKNLVTRSEIQGVIHVHSTYSDGVDDLADLADYAAAQGYRYLGITDHSQIAVYANGLDEEKLEKQWNEVDRLNTTFSNFKVLKGIECDILNDGSLDYPDHILERFDFVIASIHTNIKMDKDKATTRIIRAIENPFTNILGHPTGRLLLGRDGYPLDMERVLDACLANQVAVELNANPYRLDLDWKWIPVALEKGVQISINPDAHAKEAIDYLDFGVIIANKGWLTPDHCLNARNVEHFLTFCEK